MRAFRTSLLLIPLLSLSACGARTVLDGERSDAAVAADTGTSPADVPFTPVDVPFTGVDVPKVGVDVPFPPVDVPVITPDIPAVEFDVPIIGVDVPFPPVDVPIIGVDVPRPGLTCETAEPLGSDMPVAVTHPSGGAALPACAGSGFAGGSTRWFTVVVPAQAQLQVSPEGGVVPLLRAFSDCRAVPFCLATNLGTAGTTLTWTNNTSVDARVAIAVAPTSPMIMGTSVIRARIITPSTNGRCASATALTPGVPTPGVLAGGVELPMACANDAAPQPALFYRVRVPAGQSLSATYTALGGFRRQVSVRVAGACGGTCVAANTATSDGSTVTTRWTNTARTDLDAFISVAPTTATGAVQDFTVTATISTPPNNVQCGSATPVRDGTNLRAQDLAAATVVQPPCPGMAGTGAASLFYSAVVPRGQTLFVSASAEATGRQAPVIRVIPTCGSNVCFAASTCGGTTSSASFFNSGADQTVIIAVGASNPRLVDPFSLAVSIRAPAENGLCGSALRVMNGTTLVGQSLGDGRELPTACPVPGRDANALFYAVRVGAGEQLVVTANRAETGIAPTLRLFSACGATTCLAQSTTGGQGARLSYVNTTGAAQELLFAMNLQDGGATTAARANLAVSVARPPYTVTTIPAACDTVTGNVVAGLSGDDVGAESVPLPFALNYFGSPVTAWSASTNGYLQLWPMAGRSAGALGAFELPNSMAPPGMVAAFWDDLLITPGIGDVRWGAFDAGGRHVTVQWTDAQFCCNAMGAERLTFQVKLFTSGVIETHYCALNGSPRVNGQSASIGMQDTAALRGVSYAVRRADAVRTGLALRYAP
ncbi:MAG: hypothetical protein U0325_29805 [Polyangiales bacterium]